MARAALVADVVDRNGNSVNGATIEVRLRTDETAVAPFVGETGPTTFTPTTDADGQAVAWLDPGEYEWRAVYAAIPSDWVPFTAPTDVDAAVADEAAARTAADDALTAALDAKADLVAGRVPIDQLASGTPDGTKFLRDDGTLQPVQSGGGGTGLYVQEDAPTGVDDAAWQWWELNPDQTLKTLWVNVP